MYQSFNLLWWTLTAYLLIRLLKTDDPRWWLGIGAVFGLGMMTKYNMLVFVLGIVASVLITPTRRHLRSPWLWAGVALSLLIFLPNLIWQFQHNFVALEFTGSIHERDIEWGRTENFLPEQLFVSANPVTIPLWVMGLFFYLRSPAGRRFRMVGWIFIITFLLFFILRARGYYTAGLLPHAISRRSGLFRAMACNP